MIAKAGDYLDSRDSDLKKIGTQILCPESNKKQLSGIEELVVFEIAIN